MKRNCKNRVVMYSGGHNNLLPNLYPLSRNLLKHRNQRKIWSEDEIPGSFQKSRIYTVNLFFAETADLDADERIFDVDLQDKRALKSLNCERK